MAIAVAAHYFRYALDLYAMLLVYIWIISIRFSICIPTVRSWFYAFIMFNNYIMFGYVLPFFFQGTKHSE